MNNEIWPKNGAFAAKRLSGTRVTTILRFALRAAGELTRSAPPSMDNLSLIELPRPNLQLIDKPHLTLDQKWSLASDNQLFFDIKSSRYTRNFLFYLNQIRQAHRLKRH